jgi:hypothetical protein
MRFQHFYPRDGSTPIRSRAMPLRAAVSRPVSFRARSASDGWKRIGRSVIFATSLAAALMLITTSTGCVRRTITITTEPPQALVFLNDQEVGRSTVTTDFLWYGDYDVIIRKEGYKTLKTHWNVEPPWYQVVPIDFFAEVLWPGHIHDQRSRHFMLEVDTPPTKEELIQRALETRERALDPRG